MGPLLNRSTVAGQRSSRNMLITAGISFRAPLPSATAEEHVAGERFSKGIQVDPYRSKPTGSSFPVQPFFNGRIPFCLVPAQRLNHSRELYDLTVLEARRLLYERNTRPMRQSSEGLIESLPMLLLGDH
jgi:hypothetical protein